MIKIRRVLYLTNVHLFPNIPLIGQPQPLTSLQADDRKVLVIYSGDTTLLFGVLSAAGYHDPANELYLYEHSLSDPPFDLAATIRNLKVTHVMLFGQDPGALGIRALIPLYTPVTLSDCTILVAEDLDEITAARTRGDQRAAARLWKAIQQSFMRPQD